MSFIPQHHSQRGGRGGSNVLPGGPPRKRKATGQMGGGGRMDGRGKGPGGTMQQQQQQSSTQQAARRAMDTADQRSWPHMPIVGPNQLPTAGSTMKRGYAINDYYADSAVDELDRLTPRDIAAARYKRNHDMLEMVFDPLPITGLVPPPSVYASMSKEELESRLEKIKFSTDESKAAHQAALGRMRKSFPHLVAGQGQGAEETPVDADSDEEEEEQPAEEWARGASQGRIIGLGIVRAATPPEMRAQRQHEDMERRRAAAAASAANDAEAERKRRQEEIAAVGSINPTVPHSMEQPDGPESAQAPGGAGAAADADADAEMADGTAGPSVPPQTDPAGDPASAPVSTTTGLEPPLPSTSAAAPLPVEPSAHPAQAHPTPAAPPAEPSIDTAASGLSVDAVAQPSLDSSVLSEAPSEEGTAGAGAAAEVPQGQEAAAEAAEEQAPPPAGEAV